MDWKSRRVVAILEGALIEDRAAEDITTSLTIDRKLRATGSIIAREPCVVAGLGAIPVILESYNTLVQRSGAPSVGRFEVIHHPEIFDGVKVKRGQPIAVIRSNAGALLATERVMLNLLQRMSGIATLTHEFVKAVTGTKTKIVDTRKTVPGLRVLDKYAVCCGGGVNHRLDLRDGILIKRNHVALGGGIEKTLSNALKFRKGKQFVQIEIRSVDELPAAIKGGAESILLDNMTPAAVKKSIKLIRAAKPGTQIEVSGPVTLENVRAYALAGADLVAVGALTRSAVAVNLGMRIAVDAS
jgi:nicotinate-nucleotide pyrophosphorylase (carboxylating)